MRTNDYLEELMRYAFPIYDRFDKGHNRNHIVEVIDASMELAKDYDVNEEMIFVAALYHDLGLQQGREHHHTVSANMLRNDTKITEHFTPEQVEIIAEAIEDHRASAKNPPRSIYGEILASADRVIDIDTIILRSFHHSQKQNPELSLNEHIDRVHEHIVDKYGENGYMKIPILTKRNEEELNQLYAMLKDEQSIKCYELHMLHKNKAIKILYVDMDGVLVDFGSAISELDNNTCSKYEGHLDDIPHIFSKMQPLPKAIESYRYLATKFDTYILTTAPWDNPTAMDDKKAWVKKYLGDVAHKRLIITHQKNLLKDKA